jgi:deoxyribodipyrimidine photolyase-related protein
LNQFAGYKSTPTIDKSLYRTGNNACPFNFFCWDFLVRHRDKLQSQGRMSFILKNLDKIPFKELQEIRQKAATWHGQQQNPYQ